jgi:hypothetical protein
LPLDEDDRKSMRLVLVVVGGFVAGVAYLMYILATDL